MAVTYSAEVSTRTFEIMINDYLTYWIPLAVILGYCVNVVNRRRWDFFCKIPLTVNLANYVSYSSHGQDERCRLMRRNIMRFANLSYVMRLRMISTRVKKRFPTLDPLVEAGLMLPDEKIFFDDLESCYSHQE